MVREMVAHDLDISRRHRLVRSHGYNVTIPLERTMDNMQPRIYVAGHNGLVGSAIVRTLRAQGHTNIVTRSHAELELTDQAEVRAFFRNEQIDQVYLAAAKVGGIHANNTYPAEFIFHNLMVQANVVHEAWRNGVRKLLFLGSSCIYPRLAEQPIREEYLMNGMLEPTNEPYAIAKIAGIKLCESYNRQYGTDYRSVMPTNLDSIVIAGMEAAKRILGPHHISGVGIANVERK
jgi:GDP-L-fucose synthase